MHHSDFRLYDHPRLCFILYSSDISNACHHRDTLKAKTHHLIGEQSSVAYIPRIIASIFSAKKKKKDSIHIPSPYHLYIFKRSVPAANYSVRDLLWRDIQKDVMKSKRKNLTYLKSNLSFHPIIESVKIYWDSQCTM